ncbi:MAG TPA: VWA domain-containing protein [Acidobacteriota bacterium]|nr:VWA domain-containing protein [Acidobacteriota bacterium]
MKKAIWITAIVSPLILVSPRLFPQQGINQRPVIRTSVDVVNVLCTVRENKGKGRYVEGLTKEDFEVFEDGVPQTIQYFNHGMGEEADPLSIALLIDTSGSIKSKLAFEQLAAVEFLKSTLRQNKGLAAIVQFHEEIELLQDFTYDQELLRSAIMKTRAGGGTKLYDAIFTVAEDLLGKEVGRRVAVVLSDGDDTLSMLNKKDAIRAAQEHDVVIFGLGIKSADTNYGALKDFSRDTGGLFVDSEIDLDRLREAFSKINGEIKNQYSIGYVSHNKARDGEFREIKVKVKRRGLKITHRKGYYAPKAES